MSYLDYIPTNWKVTTIDKEAIVVTDYVANGSFASLKENVTYLNGEGYARLIRLTDHNRKYNGEGIYVNEHSYKFLKKSKIKPNDIIISNVGEYSGTVFKAPDLKMPMTLGPNSILVKFKDSHDFMFYFLQSSIGQHLINTVKSGSANPKFNKTEFKKIEFIIPPPVEQKSIAAILTAFDDKIKLLQAQNKTLEETAQTIFKEWFGKYQIGDELPEGWRVGKLGEVGKIICGKTPSKLNNDFFGNEIPFIKIPDMHNKMFVLETSDNLSFEGAMSQSNKMLPKNSICISCIATVGLVSITTKKSQTNQQINSIIPNSLIYREFLYFALTNMKDFLNDLGSGGTATLNVNTSTFSNLELIIPSEPRLQEFHTTENPFFDKILYNNSQIQTLTQTRDELLPKLMSGEIRAKEYDR